MALFKENILCGLCKSVVEPVFLKPSLLIKTIEEHPDKEQNPLKGYLIATFTQANLDIAKVANILSIGVRSPLPRTRESYIRVGLQLHSASNEVFTKTVSQDSTLNWDRFFKSRTNKGLSCHINS